MIKERFGVSMPLSAVAKFLKNSIKRLKNSSLPAKADTVRQRGFYNGTLNSLMDKAAGGMETLLFMDASHFVMECGCLGFIFVKSELRTQFYDDFTVFCGRIDQIIAGTSTTIGKL